MTDPPQHNMSNTGGVRSLVSTDSQVFWSHAGIGKRKKTKAVAIPTPFLIACQSTHLTVTLVGKPEVTWKTRVNKYFIPTPLKPVEHDLTLVCCNCIRTGYGRFKYNMNQMRLSPLNSIVWVRCWKSECIPHDQRVSDTPMQLERVVLDTAARNWLRDLQCVRCIEQSWIKRKKKNIIGEEH